MSRKHIEWLYGELQELTGRGVIDPATAERLRSHYGEVEPGKPTKTALLVFSILGAILIGAGIILVLAHNWDLIRRKGAARE